MATFNLRQYRDIYTSIKNYIISHQTRVSDFNTGSVIASEIEAFAREMALVYSETRAGFSEVLTKMPFTIFNLSKNPSQKAIGTVTFSRVVTTGTAFIPIGTQVSTAGGVIFETTAAGSMDDGVGSVTVAVRALNAGTEGNVPAGTISIFVSGITGVDTVQNSSNVGGGVNEETDSEYLSRFRSYLLGLAKSNVWGLIAGALENPALRSASVVEHFPPRAGLYNLTLYLDDGQGAVSPTIISEVQAMIDGNGTLASPGYRAAGINVDYLAPSIVTVAVSGTVYFSYEVSQDEAKSLVDAKVLEFLNAHVIGQDVIRAQLQKTILDFPWILDLDLVAPSGNTAIGDGQIARAGAINLTYQQVTES